MTSTDLHRPLVTVQQAKEATKVPMPCVLTAPIRPDIVQLIHRNMTLSNRQPHAHTWGAGTRNAAHSWGTGRAVSRIPRISGGGSRRSGQGAFGNMCVKGRRYGATKVFKRWAKGSGLNERRYAVCSALAASAVAPLVMAKGHRIDEAPEIPLVIADAVIDPIKKTKHARAMLESLGLADELKRCQDGRKNRGGEGKKRNRVHKYRRGPLIIYDGNDDKWKHLAFQNLQGLEITKVDSLGLPILAPGGHVGRLIVWTESAFKALDSIFGTYNQPATRSKIGYCPPRPIMANPNISRFFQSETFQAINKRERMRQLPKNKYTVSREKMEKLNPFLNEFLKLKRQWKLEDKEHDESKNNSELAEYWSLVYAQPMHPKLAETNAAAAEEDEDMDLDEDLLDIEDE